MAENFLKEDNVNSESMLSLFEVLEETRQVFSRASRRTPTNKASSWATGAFTHGGVSGLRNGSKRLPAVTSFFAKFARDVVGAEHFATVVVQKNGRGSIHRDFHNKPGSKNWVCPLTSCAGGGLWVQAEGLEPCYLQDVEALEEREVRPGTRVKGRVMKTEKGEPFAFDPTVWHEVQAHEGDRVMVVAFSPKLTNFDEEESKSKYLSSLGFPLSGRENGEQLPGISPVHEEFMSTYEAGEVSLVNLNEAGMEVFQTVSGAFEVHQRGYILDLLRSHDMQDAPGTQLPCPRDWITDEVPEEAETFSEEELRFGQRVVGEQLWLTMRTRPDLQFVVQHMAQWVSKRPRRVAKTAKRVLAYLVTTLDFKLVLGENSGAAAANSSAAASSSSNSDSSSIKKGETPRVILVGYSDSSFAPYGARSYGAAVVTVCASPVAWKSGRQQMITLSTMESELLEATNTVTLLESVGCLIDEFCGQRIPRTLRVDNSAATAMLCGGAGSWRTRHLRVRRAFVREQVQQGLLHVSHVEGRCQLADLATKMHPRMRLLDLLYQWSFAGLPHEALQLQAAHVIMMGCLGQFRKRSRFAYLVWMSCCLWLGWWRSWPSWYGSFSSGLFGAAPAA